MRNQRHLAETPSCRILSSAVMIAAVLCGGPALAQTTGTQPGAPAAAPATPAATPAAEPTPTGFWERPTLLGDPGGLRSALSDKGVTISLTDTSEVLGNTSGGFRQGAGYDGLTTLTVQVDTAKAFGFEGGTINVSGLQIRGRNFPLYYLGALQSPSGIAAAPTTRLWEAWYQQALFGGAVDVRIGQQSADQEFMTSQNAALFMNLAMGWPALPTANLYAGGPSYPLSSLGARLRGKAGPFTGLLGVYQDNPPGGPFNDDSQLRGSTLWGGNFNLRTGALVIAEVQYALNPPADTDIQPAGQAGTPTPDQAAGLQGIYKLGAWYDSGAFPSQRYDYSGVSLADPLSNGKPRLLVNNYSVYAMGDQMVWRDGAQSVSVFARAMVGPGDRNLVSFSLNAGVTWKAPLPGRDNDTIGLGYGLGRISSGAQGLARDTAFFQVPGYPSRSHEQFVELFYQAQITPWLQLQPDFQYIVRPAGGIPNPNNPSQRIGDEAVFGIRSAIVF